jgi:hypothetical protein
MGRLHRSTALAAVCGAALALSALAGVAQAAGEGGSTGGSSGGTGSTSSGCGCVPTTHQVKVPGIEVTAPSVTVNLPTLNVSGSSGSSSADSSSSSSSNSSAVTNIGVSVTNSSSGVSNAQAQANAAYGGGSGGGGGSFSDSGSVTTTIDTVRVETPASPETRRICAEFKAAVKVIAVQASCLDDKDIPHPASQLGPEREIGDAFDGEVYRCIAGARMQYTIADYAGQANFDHGQTFTCAKGEALYHTAAGALQCRVQKPARDCNERSLLRRFGAGIKVLKVSQSNVCVAWRTETVQASAAY